MLCSSCHGPIVDDEARQLVTKDTGPPETHCQRCGLFCRRNNCVDVKDCQNCGDSCCRCCDASDPCADCGFACCFTCHDEMVGSEPWSEKAPLARLHYLIQFGSAASQLNTLLLLLPYSVKMQVVLLKYRYCGVTRINSCHYIAVGVMHSCSSTF